MGASLARILLRLQAMRQPGSPCWIGASTPDFFDACNFCRDNGHDCAGGEGEGTTWNITTYTRHGHDFVPVAAAQRAFSPSFNSFSCLFCRHLYVGWLMALTGSLVLLVIGDAISIGSI